jgi:hypothetical protein
MANFSRIFDDILVHYKKISGWQGKELEFVGRGKHPALRATRDDMQIRIITCWKSSKPSPLKWPMLQEKRHSIGNLAPL